MGATWEEMIETWFTYHPPTPDQIPKYNQLRESAKKFALEINELVPDGSGKEKAIESLRTAVMFANAGIACNA